MNCYCCKKETNNKKKICRECFFDPYRVINYTDVKKKFKLSNMDLNEYKDVIFSMPYILSGQLCTKYIYKEILNISKKIVEKNPEDIIKRKAYEDEKCNYLKWKRELNERKYKRKMLKKNINELIKKCNIIYNDNFKQKRDQLINYMAKDYHDLTKMSLLILERLDVK